MFLWLLLPAAFLAVSHGQECDVNFRCPRNADLTCMAALFTFPYNCTQYQECTEDCRCFLRPCSPPLQFDEQQQGCDWDYNVNCVATPRPSLSTTTMVTTTMGTTTPAPPLGEPSLSVALQTERDTALSPVPFDNAIINYAGSYGSGNFTVPQSGVYFFHLSAGVKARGKLDYGIYKDAQTPYFQNIRRVDTNTNGEDTVARDVMYGVTEGDVLQVRSFEADGLYSDSERQTSWSGFSLDAVMNRTVAFSAYRTSQWAIDGPIPFPTFNINEGFGFNPTTGCFVAPQAGVYYFSWGTGAVPNVGQRTQLTAQKLGEATPTRVCELWRQGAGHNGIDQLNRATLVQLAANEKVCVQITTSGGQVYSSIETRETSFLGFLYQPNGPRVAWSVHRTSAWNSSARLDPVGFEDVLVNEGRAWNALSSTIIIPVTGVYFIQANVAALPNKTVNFNMVYNNIRSEADVLRNSITHQGVDGLGRGVIAEFDEGDTIKIVSSPNTGFYSDADRQTSFTGFLLFPTPPSS